MARTATTRPAKTPVRAGVVRDSVKPVAKKTVPKKTVASKSTTKPFAANTKKPRVPADARARRAAADAARLDTVAKTTRRVDDTPLVIDPDDTAALEKADRHKAHVIPDTAVNTDASTPESGAGLVARVSRAVERELEQIELIVGGGRIRSTQRSEAERRARTLASLARTLSEVRRLRATEDAQRSAYEPSEARDLDAFRKELWRRLEGMAARPADVPAAGDEPE